MVLSGFLCITLAFFLWEKTKADTTFSSTLKEVPTIFISISGFMAALIMIYLGGVPWASRLFQWSPTSFIRFFNAGTVRPSRLAAEARSLRSSVSIRRT